MIHFKVSSISDFPQKSGIYMFKNKVNGKIYIGESKNMKCRMRGHRNTTSGKRNGMAISRAFEKYGFDSFEFFILEIYPNKMTEDFLVKREAFWIEFYGSLKNKIGYNSTLKREKKETMPSKFQPNEAQRAVMRDRMMGNTVSRGVIHTEETIERVKAGMAEGMKRRCRPVLQLDLETGDFIKEWDSCAHAARELVGNPHAHAFIAKVARKDPRWTQAYGFQWKFKDGKEGGLTKFTGSKKILQLDKDSNEIIKQWDSVAQAVRFLESQGIRARISDISRSAKTDHKTAFGYKWRFA